MVNDAEVQRAYYAATGHSYDTVHESEMRDLSFAVHIMLGMTDFLHARSILDIGSGTGRLASMIRSARPEIDVKGIEPVRELRDLARSKGLDVIDGNAMALPFSDGEFDVVCEFAVLHHIKQPERVVDEMLRVAQKAIYLADSNNFGQGSLLARIVKQGLHAVGLWPAVNFLKTRGKGYTISDGDGLAYSYSVYDSFVQILRQCERVHVINIAPSGVNPYRTSSSVALLGIKHQFSIT